MRYLLSSTKDQMTDPAIVQALASQVNPENLEELQEILILITKMLLKHY